MAFSFPFFWRTKESGKPIIKEAKGPAVAKDIVTETAKPTVNIPKGFKKDIGEDHPFDFELVENICKSVPIVSGAVNKTVDMCISDFQIKSDNTQIKKICDDFIEQNNFDMYLRAVANNLVKYANSFTEIVSDRTAFSQGTKITELKPLNPKYLYVKRDEYGTILGYTQCINLGAGKKIPFAPFEIAHYKYNVIGDSAYGYSMVAPLINIITNKLNMERSMMLLMDRKANAPIHVKVGTNEEPATSDDVQQFANDLYNINNRTEWVTDHRVDIQTIDFAGKIMNFAPFNEHFENQLVYGLEVPIVLLGRGNIPEGLATVQLEAFARRLASIRLLIENVNEQSIFLPLIHMAGLRGKVQFDWEPQSEEDKWKQVENITALMGSVSDPIRQQLEQRIAKILGIEIAVQPPAGNIFSKPPALQPGNIFQKPAVTPPAFQKPNPFAKVTQAHSRAESFNSDKKRFLIVGKDGLASDIAYQLKKEGNEVKWYVESEKMTDVMDGFIERSEDWEKDKDWANIIIFEDTGFGTRADELRKDGYLVIGAASLCDNLEHDREFASKWTKEHMPDVVLPEVHKFGGFVEALDFVKSNKKRWVLKFNGKTGNSKELLYIGKEDDGSDVLAMLQHYQNSWNSEWGETSFILQEYIEGTEIGISGWFNGQKFVKPFYYNFEYKKLLAGDVGILTGQEGEHQVWTDSFPLFDITLGEIEGALAESGYVGSFNINGILNEKGYHFLEFTPRFGYDSISIEIENMKGKVKLTELFTGLLARYQDFEIPQRHAMGVVISVPTYPYEKGYAEQGKGLPLLKLPQGWHPHDVRFEDGKWITAGSCGYICTVAAADDDFEKLKERVYVLIKELDLPKMQYRVDIGTKWEKDKKMLMSQDLISESASEEQRLDLTIEKWTLRNPFPLIERIKKFLERHPFSDVDVSAKSRDRLRGILSRGMENNITLTTLSRRIANGLGVEKTRAEMIARTESVRATAEALLEDFADKDIAKVRWVVIDDTRLCEKCAPMQGKVFEIKYAHGKIPPHPGCRCSWSAVFQ